VSTPAKLVRFGYPDWMIKQFYVKESLEITFQWVP
jgi:hypothetical protein